MTRAVDAEDRVQRAHSDLHRNIPQRGLQALSGNLGALAAQSKLDADRVYAALEGLTKLDGIIANVSQLDSDLEQAQRELGADVQDTPEEQMGRTSVDMALIAVVLALASLVLLPLFQRRRVAKEATPERPDSPDRPYGQAPRASGLRLYVPGLAPTSAWTLPAWGAHGHGPL